MTNSNGEFPGTKNIQDSETKKELYEQNLASDVIDTTNYVAKPILDSNEKIDLDVVVNSDCDNNRLVPKDVKKDTFEPADEDSKDQLEIDQFYPSTNDNSIAKTLISAEKSIIVNSELEDVPISLLLADPPSGFKDSIADPLPAAALVTETTDDITPLVVKGSTADDISCGSDSFDRAINKIADDQDSADDDLGPSSYTSLPPDLSQVRPVSSNLAERQIETSSETTMPEQNSSKQIGSTGPMKFSIAGYTERTNKEPSYTEKLKLGRSDSNVSSYNSSLRWVNAAN